MRARQEYIERIVKDAMDELDDNLPQIGVLYSAAGGTAEQKLTRRGGCIIRLFYPLSSQLEWAPGLRGLFGHAWDEKLLTNEEANTIQRLLRDIVKDLPAKNVPQKDIDKTKEFSSETVDEQNTSLVLSLDDLPANYCQRRTDVASLPNLPDHLAEIFKFNLSPKSFAPKSWENVGTPKPSDYWETMGVAIDIARNGPWCGFRPSTITNFLKNISNIQNIEELKSDAKRGRIMEEPLYSSRFLGRPPTGDKRRSAKELLYATGLQGRAYGFYGSTTEDALSSKEEAELHGRFLDLAQYIAQAWSGERLYEAVDSIRRPGLPEIDRILQALFLVLAPIERLVLEETEHGQVLTRHQAQAKWNEGRKVWDGHTMPKQDPTGSAAKDADADGQCDVGFSLLDKTFTVKVSPAKHDETAHEAFKEFVSGRVIALTQAFDFAYELRSRSQRGNRKQFFDDLLAEAQDPAQNELIGATLASKLAVCRIVEDLGTGANEAVISHKQLNEAWKKMKEEFGLNELAGNLYYPGSFQEPFVKALREFGGIEWSKGARPGKAQIKW